jgi:hypothetical protein
MSSKKNIRREGAYIVKSAESRPSRVTSKTYSQSAPVTPTSDDKRLVAALRRSKARVK